MKRIVGLKSGQPKKRSDINEIIQSVDDRSRNFDTKIRECNIELKQIQTQLKNSKNESSKQILREKANKILIRRKQYESMSENLKDQAFNMEQTTSSLQTALTTQDITLAMHHGVKQMKKAYQKVKIDEIEDLQDEMESLVETTEEIQNAFEKNSNNNYAVPDLDDEQLMNELDALGDEIIADNDRSYLDQSTQVLPPSINNNSQSDMLKAPKLQDKNLQIAVDEFGLPIANKAETEDSSKSK